MSRVIRNVPLTATPAAFGSDGPQFVDDWMAELLDRAREEGFEAGRREGVATGRADVAGSAERVEKALARVTADLHRSRAAAVSEIVDIALEVAEFALGRASHDDGAALTDRIAQALEDIDDEDVTVAVNPRDWDAVAAAVQLPKTTTIERDPALRLGEARITGKWASADLTYDAALAIAREVLT